LASAAQAAAGKLHGTVVVVEETAAANRLHNKGFVGTPRPGNTLELSLVEAAWCVAQGRLALHANGKGSKPGPALTSGDLLALDSGGRAEVEYLAYADLRERGLVVQHRDGALHVLARGQGKGEVQFVVHARAERDVVDLAELGRWAEAGAVVGIVDEDGAVTHYRAATSWPEGNCLPGKLPPAEGRLLADRVLVEDAGAAKAYREREFLGTPHGDGLFLSFTEAEALRQRGLLAIGSDLPKKASQRQLHFQRTLPVYQALRANGVVAKSGFRFGTHLRCYRGDPDQGHAQWLVHCTGEGTHWSELSRAVRLAHGVRKSFLAAFGQGKETLFVELAWLKV
jgi:tRNA-intron endonuclease, archaea type